MIAVAAADAVAVHRDAGGPHPARRGDRLPRDHPKSNAAYLAIDKAIADVRAGGFGRVPPHLRDAHYPGAKRLGHGKGYVYPHDSDSASCAAVPARRTARATATTSRPSHGKERDVQARLEKIRRILGG